MCLRQKRANDGFQEWRKGGERRSVGQEPTALASTFAAAGVSVSWRQKKDCRFRSASDVRRAAFPAGEAAVAGGA